MLPWAVCREITLLDGSVCTHSSCFNSVFLHSLTLISCLHSKQRKLYTPLPVGRMSGHYWWCHHPSDITSCNSTCWWQMKDIYQSECLHPPNFVPQLTGVRWILNIWWCSFLQHPSNCCRFFHLLPVATLWFSCVKRLYITVLYVCSPAAKVLVALSKLAV